MNTPWGDIAVSDAHVHFFSHGFLSLLTREPVAFVAAKLGWEAPPVEPEDLAARWVEELQGARLRAQGDGSVSGHASLLTR